MTTLFVWIVVSSYMRTDTGHWEKLETFTHPTVCHQAAANLSLDKGIYRCITVNTGEKK